VALVVAFALFGWVVYAAGLRLGSVMGPHLEALEAASSP
jgi:hypothetical protein